MSEYRLVHWTISLVVVACLEWLHAHEIRADEPDVVSNSLGMKLVAIPAGEFQMGTVEEQDEILKTFPESDPKWLASERPRHRVRITNPFYMSVYETTLGQFMKFCDEARYKIDAERDRRPSWGFEDEKLILSNRFRPWDPVGWKIEMDHPAVYVTWKDSVAFCDWLSKKEGLKYRLPTEAEWEYACRAGTSKRFCFGDNPEELRAYANIRDADRKDRLYESIADEKIASLFSPWRDGYAWTAPVGRFKPNAFGLYDMHGNVAEWCSDWYDKNYYKDSPEDDPPGPATGITKVLRGGSYYGNLESTRCAARFAEPQSTRTCSYGFRIVRER